MSDPRDIKIIGDSSPIRDLRGFIPKVAAHDCSVLIRGETGTGKERIAEAIHRCSARRDAPLVAINCAAIPDTLLESELFGYEKGAFTGANIRYEGKLKAASGGTLFLDEIGDMTPLCQAKILRAIENKELYHVGSSVRQSLDVRIVAATNQDLQPMLARNAFRKDLFYRLNVVSIHLPPLRERREDIPLLLDYYVRLFNARFKGCVEGFTPNAMAALLRYDWPGNIRELRNLIELIFVDPPRVVAFDALPGHIQDAPPSPGPADEKRELIAALVATNWNKSRAAERLHWSRMTVYRKIDKYNLHEEP
ncbi:MAG TPA: sigma 54-interacting transcriptional regulator [Rhodanobacteraceae bacterium]|nr:sigma 54-interacting transcriptional regulator [Rhodanobacteraceae bacterium]